MSGVVAARYLLVNSAAVLAQVPAQRIKAGELPEGTPLPAISIAQVNTDERKSVSGRETKRLFDERVQITVHAEGYSQADSILGLVLKALPATTRGDVGGIAVDSIESLGRNPDDFDEQPGVHQHSRDFAVRYTASVV